MKISLKWLNDFVDVSEFIKKPAALADLLTKAGLEVEDIQNRSESFRFVVVGMILEKDRHPNADKLSLCRVMTGEGVVHQIVCGAQNHKTNDRVVVALPGAVLPGNFSIERAVVRGIESGGMLCSLKELGLTEKSDGIEILPEDAPIGRSFAEYRGLDDVIFELKVTANRADCLSHFGLAREIACLLGRGLKKPQLKMGSADALKVSSLSSRNEMALEVKNSDLCPRYTGRCLMGVKVGPSPDWLQKRLESVGVNSINNVVDCTNYVMIELGQPLHAFDAEKINGKKVIVELAQPQEKFTTLDGTELTLSGEELMIRDTQRSLCVAGVIGGKNSGVTETTTSLFLESAYFSPMSVRKSLRAHGLNTDSGYRFARGVDPEGSLFALERATEMILSVAGGEALSEPYDVYPARQSKEKVHLKLATVSERLGYAAEGSKFEAFMKGLGCELEVLADGDYRVTPPSYRFDLELDMDLVEEYARLNGYDQIPERLPDNIDLAPSAHDLNYLLQRKTSEIFRGQGFSQAVHLALVGAKSELHFVKSDANMNLAGLNLSEMPVKILNPLNEEQNCLRKTLSYGLFRNLCGNFHQGNENGRLFEIGKTFSFEGPESYKEHWRLGLSAWGYPWNFWQPEPKNPIVFELKAAMETWLKTFHIFDYEWVPVQNRGEIPNFLHRGQAAHLMVEGQKVGFIGTLHPVLLEEEKVRVSAALAEMNLDLLLKGQPRGLRVETPSRFPSIQRDLALVMQKTLPVGSVRREIRDVAGEFLRSVGVFDVYEGEKLEGGLKSVTFQLLYQDKKDTLRDEMVNASIEKVLQHLKAQHQITVR
ncbi:MAG: phenylalanine--tRNA ligase subunit beta [Bdellovibrio sp. CG10_big_fil_rev_8_21_14_0_10_47_8]|nr:MAG: phenylalanine--tRNA ligase subunit beta [Bdellovibrio sp. CG10_big_fil_rev_8_21_14_0_10_47_8]